MFSLQRQLFAQNEERLLAVVHVKSVKKTVKKRAHKSLLCLTVKNDVVTLQKVKAEKGKEGVESYDTRHSWSLEHLIRVDAVSSEKHESTPKSNNENRTFILEFDKVYRWQALDAEERNQFLFILHKLCKRYLKEGGPEFENFGSITSNSDAAFEDETIANRSELNPKSPLSPTPDGPAGEDLDEGTELTAQQEEDIDEVLAGRDWSQNDAEEYSTRLGDQLSKLENENFQSIIASEREVEMLMEQLGEALSTLDEMEETIVKYNSILGHVKSDVMVVAEQNGIVVGRTENENALLKEVQTLVDYLDFPQALLAALLYGDLSISATVNQVNEAVAILADKRKQALSPGLELMTSVNEKLDQLGQWEEQFANRLVQFFLDHLNEQIKQQSVHEIRRRRLQPYGELMKWLRNCEPSSSFSKFSGLCQAYTRALHPVYLRELKEGCERAKTVLKGKKDEKDDGPRRQQFDAAFNELLSEVIPSRIAEHEFCDTYFIGKGEEQPDGDTGGGHGRLGRVRSSDVPRHGSVSLGQSRENEILAGLFEGTGSEILAFVEVAQKHDGFNIVSIMCRLQQISETTSSKPLLRKPISLCLKQVRMRFDVYINSVNKAIEEAKTPAKKQFGIFLFCDRFAATIGHMEKVVTGAGDSLASRNLVDRAMIQLTETVMASIDRISNECKYHEVAVFENYHHLHDSLSKLKVTCLQSYRTTAQEKYRESLNLYVSSILGRPLEKLSAFFEAIERLIQAGTKPEEVGYQMAFSKQELRKVIAQYPGKEVKKNLEAMYRRVDRHLCDEERLLEVVWHNIQQEFVKQYNRFEELIAKCYPSSPYVLEFDVNDLLSYFNTIAQTKS